MPFEGDECIPEIRSQRQRIAGLEAAMLEAADILRGLSMGTEGHLRGRICSASNRLDRALGRGISSHGDQPCKQCGVFVSQDDYNHTCATA